MMQTAPTTIEYRAADHGFFEELVRLAVSLGSIGVGLELQKSGKAKPFSYNDTIAIVGKPDVSGLEIHFRPRPLFDRLLSPSGRQPRFLTIVKRTINPSPPEHPIFLSKIQLMMARLIGDAFVSYYERHVDAVVARWQEKRSGWPDVWRFGWAIRNACSHDGKILIQEPKHPGVHWRNLKYDFNDNGRRILFDDLTGVELILLMEEMDAELRYPQPLAP
jgi:hypothetical protein